MRLKLMSIGEGHNEIINTYSLDRGFSYMDKGYEGKSQKIADII
jgi:hypothetical protein